MRTETMEHRTAQSGIIYRATVTDGFNGHAAEVGLGRHIEDYRWVEVTTHGWHYAPAMVANDPAQTPRYRGLAAVAQCPVCDDPAPVGGLCHECTLDKMA